MKRRHVEIRCVGNNFDRPELDAPRERSLRHGRGFHVDCNGGVGFCETKLLVLARNVRGAYERSVTRANIRSHAIDRINNVPRHEHIANLQRSMQRAGKAN